MLFISGLPIAQGSKKAFQKNGRIVLVESATGLKPWREKVAAEASRLDFPLAETEAISLELMFMMPQPKKPQRRYPTTKPDIDKLSRAILDALTGVLYKDDSQVTFLNVQKVYTFGEPGVYLTISALNNDLITPPKM